MSKSTQNFPKLSDWGALGYAIGKKAENKIPYITGIKTAQLDELKSFCASTVTYGNKNPYST